MNRLKYHFRGNEQFSLNVRTKEWCDLSSVPVPEQAQHVMISRYADNEQDGAMEFKDAGLLNGLRLPALVDTLILTDSPRWEHVAAPVFSMGTRLTELITSYISEDDVIRICERSPMLMKLFVSEIPRMIKWPNWIPSELRVLTLRECCLESIPSDLAMMLPNLRCLYLDNNRIKTLRGVVFPSLTFLVLDGNSGLSLDGAQYPESLENLGLSRCAPLQGYNMTKFPRGLEQLYLNESGIEWISKKFEIPPGLTVCTVDGNPRIDTRMLINYFGATTNIHRLLQYTHMYDHQDAITLFLHNRVLPIELLRHIFEYLE